MSLRRRVVALLSVCAITVGVVGVAAPAKASQPLLFDSPTWSFARAGGGYWVISTNGSAWKVGGGLTTPVLVNDYHLTTTYLIGAAGVPDGTGFWTIDSNNLVRTYGDPGSTIAFYGDIHAVKLNKPIVAMESTPTGHGYWMVGSEGAVFTFGDAQFFGSTGATLLPAPIVDIATSAAGHGYVLLGLDGKVYPFGDAIPAAPYTGTPPSSAVGIAVNHGAGGGFWIADWDGTIHPFGGAPVLGSAVPPKLNFVTDILGGPSGGYRIMMGDGTVQSFGAVTTQDGVLVPAAPHATVTNDKLNVTISWTNPPRQPGSPNEWMQAYDVNGYGLMTNTALGAPGTPQSVTIPLTTARFDLKLYVSFVNDAGGGYSDAAAIVTPPPCGYWMVGKKGTVYPFGCAANLGDAAVGGANAVDIEGTLTGNGYWVVDDQGHVFPKGDAPWFGNAPALTLFEAVTSIAGTVTGGGYWIFTSKGRVFPLGDAVSFGDMGAVALNGPVLDGIVTPSGRGYYMLGSDGGVFSFGDADFYGSLGAIPPSIPIVSVAPVGG